MAKRSKVVNQAKKWLGKKESDGSFKEIIDIYNAHKPLARGYKVKYTDEWCATYGSAVAIESGSTDVIPLECGCGEQIKLWQKLGCWVENDAYVPSPGDYIYYDWEDSGKGDNKGWPNHVGIVIEVTADNRIVVAEGNYDNMVKCREISVNSKYIRGYGVPKYEVEDLDRGTIYMELKVLARGSKKPEVGTVQRILHTLGYDLGDNPFDNSFGPLTEAAVRKYQEDNGLAVDGVVGKATWTSLLR